MNDIKAYCVPYLKSSGRWCILTAAFEERCQSENRTHNGGRRYAGVVHCWRD